MIGTALFLKRPQVLIKELPPESTSISLTVVP
jgi:hypothetical protein